LKQSSFVTYAVLIVATAAFPALADTTPKNDEAEGVDCFYAENAADPLCRSASPADIALRHPDTETGAPDADDDTRTVDCFFAVNREDPLCRPAPAASAALLK
jgi:hypothetical protein